MQATAIFDRVIKASGEASNSLVSTVVRCDHRKSCMGSALGPPCGCVQPTEAIHSVKNRANTWFLWITSCRQTRARIAFSYEAATRRQQT
jgi:hypothetical protein